MASASEPADLCTRCGLCCNGALFDYGPLAPEEVAGAREAGLDIISRGDKDAFGCPCPQLRGSVCQVYERRPETCRAFRCKILIDLDRGSIALEEGLERIEQARRALDGVKAQLPEGASVKDARRWRLEAGEAGPSETLAVSPLVMIALGMLDVVLDEHFRAPNQYLVMERPEKTPR